ncbi:hypothetical protein [Pseudactinotalea suaedae]|uniref:hypothetical protein n=1 Tax=Pseudactinotalea suaedae TaxID=1524924 RepID=UPI0012E206EB|nr:hypothetical protein [Pseudactinotalea suaedae]
MIAMLLAGLLALLLAFAFLAPLESMRWWARRAEDRVLGELTRADIEPDGVTPLSPQPRRFVVYLSGIGAVDGSTSSRRERAVLDAVAEQLPDVAIAADVFPYAVENRGLTQRASMWFWKVLRRLQRIPVAKVASYLINLRNALRVLVSADPRYGPTYNLAVAQEIASSLTRHGYDWEARPPVTVIGYSGGGQIALGCSWYLAALGVPISVISIGGVLSDDPALQRVQHVWHLYGSKDRTHMLGPLVFPGRWPTAPLSDWHKAKHAGRITLRTIGPMKHMGGRDYFDRHHLDAAGTSYRQLTVDALVEALSQ